MTRQVLNDLHKIRYAFDPKYKERYLAKKRKNNAVSADWTPNTERRYRELVKNFSKK